MFLMLGGLFLAGLSTDLIGRLTKLPRVSLLLLFGFMIGPGALNILPELGDVWRSSITNVALVMVGFLLGEKLTLRALRERGREVLWISLSVTIFTAAVVFLGLWLLGMDIPLALFLAGIATATDPIATMDVAREQGSKGPATDTLLSVVAIDDAWGLLLFTMILIVVESVEGAGGTGALRHGLMELGGSLGLGMLLGVPMALLTGRLRPGEPTQTEAIGFMCLCIGISSWLGLSFMLAAIALGATVANLAKHHQYPFHAIEGIEWPFMILFFIFAGSSLDLDVLLAGSMVTLAFIVLRVLGRLLGNCLGATIADAPTSTRRWLGLAMLPQAGVAAGMALVAAQRYPQYSDQLISLVIGTTVFFEIAGPIATRFALVRMGEIKASSSERDTG